jgi:hypothetical protein
MKKRALLAGTIAIIVGLWFVLQPKDSNPVAAQSNPLLNGAMVAGVCQGSCPPISCSVSDFRVAGFVFRVKPNRPCGFPVSSFA